MSKKMRWLATLGILMGILMLFGAALAAPDPVTATINLSISTKGTPPETPEDYTVRLTAEGDFPMPSGASGNTYDLTVHGATTGSFPAISFDRVGIYNYTVAQLAGTTPRVQYDDKVYHVRVIVSNSTDGGFNIAWGARLGQESKTKVEITFENTYPVEKTVKAVRKVWDDEDDQDGKRPESLTATLYRLMKDGSKVSAGSVTLDAEKDWTDTVENLDKYETDTRELIPYIWEEGSTGNEYIFVGTETETDETTGLETTVFTNRHTPETVSATVTKQWNDAENQDGIRPKGSATLRVYLMKKVGGREAQKVQAALLKEADEWTATVDGLPRYEAGTEIAYSWTEEETDCPVGYELTSEGTTRTVEDGQVAFSTTLINTHQTDKTSLTILKIWDDADNQDGIRPDSLTMTLTADGQPAKDSDGKDVSTVVLNAGNKWTQTVELLPVKAAGRDIVYKWTEGQLPEGYTKTGDETEATLTTITNTHTPETKQVTVAKAWEDNDDQDGLRTTVKLVLTAKLEDQIIRTWEHEVDAESALRQTFDVPVYWDGGKTLAYTVDEDSVPAGYSKQISTVEGVLTVTNTHTPAETSIRVTKVWDDADNQDGKRADTAIVLTGTVAGAAEPVVTRTFEIKKDATALSTVFEHLPVMADHGKEIVYSVSEARIAEYEEPEITGSADANPGFTVTNRHTPETLSITGIKEWDDADNQDGYRPSSVIILLKADDTFVRSTMATANGWTFSFKNLPKYKNGTQIEYSVEEEEVRHYDIPEITGSAAQGFRVKNTHVPETEEASVNKVWNDKNNQDGLRPETLEVTLLGNEEPVMDEEGNPIVLTLSEANHWSGSVAGLPSYKAGSEGVKVFYRWIEPELEGYPITDKTYTVGGWNTTITNTHDTAKTVATVRKVWDDADDQDGKRPTSLTVALKANDNPVKDGAGNDITVTLSEKNQWTATVKGLDMYSGGNPIDYTWDEGMIPEYSLAGTEKDATGTVTTITNRHTPETVNISGEKVWDDEDNQDGKRPESVTILLKAGDETVRTATVTAAEDWKYSFTGMPVFSAGRVIQYSVDESAVPEYTKRISGYSITNTHTPETVDVSVEKVWDDANNQDRYRPGSVTVTLRADGVSIGNVILRADADPEKFWRDSITGLPKYRDGKEIVYTWEEEPVENYLPVQAVTNGYHTVLTNARETDKTTATVTKVWDDGNNQDGKRPTSLTVTLMANGRKAEVPGNPVTLDEGNKWTATLKNLEKNTDGQAIAYTWEEESVTGYTPGETETNGTVTTLTNTHTPETITVSGTKTWDDGNNQDGKRPESVTVLLKADGEQKYSVTTDAEKGWKYSFTDLPRYKDGTEITYELGEIRVDNYTTGINGYNLKNTHTPETVDVSVRKVWNDSDNQDGVRPASLTVTLLADGEPVREMLLFEKTVTLSPANDWQDTITGLPKYRDGQEIAYSWREPELADYPAAGNTNVTTGLETILTNTHETGKTVATVKKVWEDADNQDGKRPESLTVTLLADGSAAKDAGGNDITVTLNEQNQWTATVGNLDRRAAGKEIYYTWREDETALPAGYDQTGMSQTGTVTLLINSYTPETITIEGIKAWEDTNNQDNIRPESVTILLMADGREIRRVTTDAKHEWLFRFTDLPKYKAGAQGQEIDYTVDEVAVERYDALVTGSAAEGFTVTNVHTPDTIQIPVTKIWDDADNQDGIRPESVTVTLMANGDPARDADGNPIALELTAGPEGGNRWSGTFTDLPKYRNGGLIRYTVTEEQTAQYETPVITGTMNTGFTVTNTHKPETVSITASKVWVDDGDRDGLRPTTIRLQLIATQKNQETGAETVQTVQTVNMTGTGDIWTYTFSGLPRYTGGTENVYTVAEEAAVAGYTSTVVDYAITNTHDIQLTSREIEKRWDDNNNAAGDRPDAVRMTLMANGTRAVDSDGNQIPVQTLSARNRWRATVDNLPVNAGGATINYTWVEEDVPNYEAGNPIQIGYPDGSATTILTNTYQREYVLRVLYRYMDGTTAAPTVEEIHREGDAYDVISPVIEGYTASLLRVTGTMPGRDVEYLVLYVPGDDLTTITDIETPLGLGNVFINFGDTLE